MKLAIRVLGLVVVLSGIFAATVSSSSSKHPIPTRQVAVVSLPIPVCTPNIPTCPKR